LGYRPPATNSLFPRAPRSSADAVPRSLTKTGSSSHELCLLFRVRSCSSPARVPGSTRAPSLESLSSSRHKPAESTRGERPDAHLGSVLSVRTLSTVYSSACLVGLFRPTATSRIPTSGVCPPCPAVRTSSVRRALMTFSVSAPAFGRSLQCQLEHPRLQGVDPDSDPLRDDERFRLAAARSPPAFSLPRAFLRSPWGRLHVPSAHGLTPTGTHCPPPG